MGKNMSQTNVVFGAAGSLGAAIVRKLAALGCTYSICCALTGPCKAGSSATGDD